MSIINYSDHQQQNSYSLSELQVKVDLLAKTNSYCDDDIQIAFACSFCHYIIAFLWHKIDEMHKFALSDVIYKEQELDFVSVRLAFDIAYTLAELSPIECGTFIGSVYTTLLPKKFRARNGIYYTPHIIAERLLDVLSAQGVEWDKYSIIDPACGGGAFLVPVINRILGHHSVRAMSSTEKLQLIEKNVMGIELDTFGAWITRVLIDILLYPEYIKANRRIKNIICVDDTINKALSLNRCFDLVVGNPPYGRITLESDLRKAYSRSLYGHANLYGLFLDAALRMKTTKGIIGFVLPTSFLGGVYFKNLRQLLVAEAPLRNIDFINERDGVFDTVLQETCLAVFGHQNGPISVNNISLFNGKCQIDHGGSCYVNEHDHPWIIPRDSLNFSLLNIINSANATLRDYGFKVSTGPLVWNRHKAQLSKDPKKGMYPIIWSEAINNGNFSFDYTNRLNKYIEVYSNQENFLVTKEKILLVHRTTSKEQNRRIISAQLPQQFLDVWGGIVVENHVNMIIPRNDAVISIQALHLLLNSPIVDQIFRCISGSVAVSASELEVLPLPNPDILLGLNSLADECSRGTDLGKQIQTKANALICKAYGISEEESIKWIG